MMVNVTNAFGKTQMSWVCEVTSPQAFEGLRMSNREAWTLGPAPATLGPFQPTPGPKDRLHPGHGGSQHPDFK
jgi:homoaconitase/3-isopropylmalate dehydratase large subunit